jgi:NAD(P)-dependent dehydrogenase (short-subunit alcohol dehydrogenase family)
LAADGTLGGRVAIVTGGARGIGRVYSLGLAREGCSVVVADILDTKAVVDEIRSEGGLAEGVAVDVSDLRSTLAMAKAATAAFGRIDVLVNNAAYYKDAQRSAFDEIDVDEWDRAFAVNVRGAWLCSRAVHPQMKRQRYGKIINISSNMAWKGVPNFLHYSTSKSALVGFTRALAREVGPDNICVNVVAPDFIPDAKELADARLGARARAVIEERCLKRQQTAEDVLGTIIFLAGPGSDFITGQSYLVNGGSVLQ